jgi:accessory gene regulator protein AgrB
MHLIEDFLTYALLFSAYLFFGSVVGGILPYWLYGWCEKYCEEYHEKICIRCMVFSLVIWPLRLVFGKNAVS